MRIVIWSLVVAVCCWLPSAQGQDLTLGYNQGWIDGHYGHDLTDRFDAAAWTQVLRRTREGGGTVLRVWILEGKQKEGVIWQGHRPVGVQPALLTNLRRLTRLALAERVQVYWTLMSANWPDHWAKGIESERQFNVLNDKYGHGALFRQKVLAPILGVLREQPAANYAFDIMNEVQGSVREHFWPDGWRGARRFLKAMTAFVHAHAPGLKVTASSGHHSAAWDILLGRFDGLGLDFYDVHVYSNRGKITLGWFLARHARRHGIPIVLGEFGQKRQQVDPALQARVTRSFLAHAKRLGFAGAFAWRLIDEQAHDLRFSFYDGDRPRPALDVMRAAAGLPALGSSARAGISGTLRRAP